MLSSFVSKSLNTVARSLKSVSQPKFSFSQKNWKQRDEAAEKVYITQNEKLAMKKLLEKINIEGTDNKANMQEFQRKLDGLLKKHKVSNQAFKVQVIHLHKQL